MSEKSNEWYTPAKYVEAAREVMGDIDLDPASCALANETVKARWYWTQKDNGLAQEWWGRVWLNPPYSKGYTGLFAEKLLEEYEQGNVEQAIILTIVRTDFKWFSRLWNYPICFSGHILHFSRPSHENTPKHPNGTHRYGTAFTYLGPHEQRFIDVFSAFGRIAKAIDTPRPQSATLDLWEGVCT